MNKSNYLHILLLTLVAGLISSVFLFSDVNFSIQHTNTLTDFLYEGQTDKAIVSDYYVGSYVGGASIDLSEEVILEEALLTYEDGSTLTHRLSPSSMTHYVLNASKTKSEANPQTLTLKTNNDVYDVISLNKTSGELYSFTDGKQSYRHIYINEAGVFLGEYYLSELSDEINQNITLEFCHKDDTMSTGYHVFAKKMMSVSKFLSGEDLGFVSFVNKAMYDSTKDVYVIISWSDTNIVEFPLMKGAN